MRNPNIIEKAIASFRSLPKNWDNFNSPEVSYQAIQAFETFANKHFKFFYLRYSVMAVSGGGIQIDFSYENKMISFEIYPNGDIGVEKFANCDSKNGVPEHSVFQIDNNNMKQPLAELLDWLIA